MSIAATIVTIAAALGAGTAIGIARRDGLLSDDIDDCPTVYADEERCECPDEAMLAVDLNDKGQAICTNCGRRRV